MVSLVGQDPIDATAIAHSILKTCGDYILVDRVLSESENTIIAEWQTPTKSHYFRTDDDGQPLLLPGTITTEHLVQAGELLIYRIRGGRHEGDGSLFLLESEVQGSEEWSNPEMSSHPLLP